jgi:mono/diheme cytochrome c family protein
MSIPSRPSPHVLVTLTTVLLLALVLPLNAAEKAAEDSDLSAQPTFYRDVLPILQQNCQTCHRPAGENIGGMLAPMTLTSYDDVRPWARAIARETNEGRMPPWFASAHTDGVFQGQRSLSESEIGTLRRWAANGAAAGSPGDAPAAVVFADESTQGWTNGMPDLVVSMPQPFWVEDDVRDLNINFSTQLTETQLSEDVWVRGMELKVGGTHVHHMCASYTPPKNEETSEESATEQHAPEQHAAQHGTQHGPEEHQPSGKLRGSSLGCIALGAEPTLLPEGYGYRLLKGSKISFSMHYHKEPGPGSGSWDQSSMGLVFSKEPVTHRVRYDAIGSIEFEVPPEVDRWRVGAATTFEGEATLLALWPHAHLRAVAARYVAMYPDGSQELLLDVPEYDQEWQSTYRYIEPKTLPAGTRLEVSIWYDNSQGRAEERGFDSQQAPRFGLATTDEMMLGFMSFAHTEAIDFSSEPDRIADAGASLHRSQLQQ